MSHKSSVKACIAGPLHPAVAAQAAQLLVQLLCPQNMSVADVAFAPLPYGVDSKKAKRLAVLKAHDRGSYGHEQLVVYMDEDGELNFYKYEYTNLSNELVPQIEAAWQQAYTACAIAAALRLQGKQVQVQPTRQGELQIIGS